MSKIIGNTTATPNPRPDWNQTDATKADFIKNKPKLFSVDDMKKEVSGSIVSINDISPVEHKLDVKVSSKNLISTLGAFGTENVTIENGVVTQIEADTQEYIIFKIQYRSIEGTWYQEEIVLSTSAIGVLSIPFNIEHEIDILRFGVSGRIRDTVVGFNLLPIGTYVVSCNVTNLTQGSISWRDTQIEKGTVATPHTPHIEDLSTVSLSEMGKQLIPYPHNESSKTLNGITWTDNGDGTWTANGTATAHSYLVVQKDSTIPKGTYTLSGSPKGGAANAYWVYVQAGSYFPEYGDGITFTVDIDTPVKELVLNVYSGMTVNNLVFKPMLSLVTDKEYEPYIAPITYAVDADGTVKGVTSLCPTTTLIASNSGALIECEYFTENFNSEWKELIDDVVDMPLEKGAGENSVQQTTCVATGINSFVVGRHNVENDDALLIVGNGESSTNRSNALMVGDNLFNFTNINKTKIINADDSGIGITLANDENSDYYNDIIIKNNVIQLGLHAPDDTNGPTIRLERRPDEYSDNRGSVVDISSANFISLNALSNNWERTLIQLGDHGKISLSSSDEGGYITNLNIYPTKFSIAGVTNDEHYTGVELMVQSKDENSGNITFKNNTPIFENGLRIGSTIFNEAQLKKIIQFIGTIDLNTETVTVITFSCEGVEYTAEQGMTWRQFVDSDYYYKNNVEIDAEGYVLVDGYRSYISGGPAYVMQDDIIIEDTYYCSYYE